MASKLATNFDVASIKATSVEFEVYTIVLLPELPLTRLLKHPDVHFEFVSNYGSD